MRISNPLSEPQGISYLSALLNEADSVRQRLDNYLPVDYQLIAEWHIRVDDILKRTLDRYDYDYFYKRLRAVNYRRAKPEDRGYDHEPAWSVGLRKTTEVIKIALVDLQRGVLVGQPIVLLDPSSIEWGLWNHVEESVVNGRWDIVASQTAIYVEDKIRKWAGKDAADKISGKNLAAYNLFQQLLGDKGKFRLGRQNESGEQQGWLNLATGFAQALGNVDRHRIQKREDIKQYALGVLGAGSLLLTQIKHQHGESLKMPLRPTIGKEI